MHDTMCNDALNKTNENCINDMKRLAKECDKALKQLMEVATKQDAYIKGQGEFIVIQEEELKRRAEVMDVMEEELDAWYRNPYIMVLLGLAAGAAGTAAVGR